MCSYSCEGVSYRNGYIEPSSPRHMTQDVRTSNEARPRERSDRGRGRFLPIGHGSLFMPVCVRTGFHYTTESNLAVLIEGLFV